MKNSNQGASPANYRKVTNLSRLKELATIEVKNLKRCVTKEEIANLSIRRLDAEEANKCIYGQLTGHCNSPRSLQLILRCCTKVIDVRLKHEYILTSTDGASLIKPYPAKWGRNFIYISPIESLIARDETAGAKIIDYLQGKSKRLIL